MPARRMVEHHGSDHNFVGARCVGQGEQPVLDTISASGREAGAMARQPFVIAWGAAASGDSSGRYSPWARRT